MRHHGWRADSAAPIISPGMRADLPAGTVTFLFSDVEGSTRLLHELGAEAYATVLAEHRRLLRGTFTRHGGVEVDTQGDAFFIAFPTAEGALAAAAEAQAALAAGPIKVRMGLHTGTPLLTAEGYVGPDVHRAARICAAGHGGQMLLGATTAGLLRDADLHDLGEHRLKDLSAPERIYQAGAGEFPPLKTLYQTNLPVPVTSFLGRERELAELTTLIARDDVRLVTLTGPGGTGKTRLALAAAGASAEHFPAGVWWVPLSALNDPALVLASAAGVFGASGDLAEHIADKRLLLLFDNFEQLVEAAAEVGGLLARCPNLHVLVTSRELLQLPGEQAYPVPPLEPDEGVDLFLTRARAARPDFSDDDAIPELCARLDNLPLAIELAAARVRLLSPQQLLERLGQRLDLLKGGRGVDARQETLRATIAWSYELLPPEEQQLFARLSVFRGGWTLEAAETVADADLDTLQSLIDKSLVRQRKERFSMLETIRQFASERLEKSSEADELRHRQAEFFLALAEEAEPHLAADAGHWLDRLEREHDNLRATLDWFLERGQPGSAQRMVGLLFDFWMIHGHFLEASRWADASLAADERPSLHRAAALPAAAWFASFTGQTDLARRRAEEALALARELGDFGLAARARHILGGLETEAREWSKARDIYLECLEDFTKVGDDHMVLVTRRSLAWVYEELGDIERCRQLHEENLEHARRVGHRRIEARALSMLATVALQEGRLESALEQRKASIAIDRELGSPVFIALGLAYFAELLLRLGRPRMAAELFARSDLIWSELGTTPESWMDEDRDRILARIRQQLDEAEFAAAWQRGRALSLEAAFDQALGLSVARDVDPASGAGPPGSPGSTPTD
jgi:predicted ATPase/class 3 adenylate cyclase